MSEAKEGAKVKVNYTGKLDSGEVFDSSADREPLEFVVGQGQIIPGFEKAVIGMEPGESKTVKVEPEEAYGERTDERIFEVPREELPEDIEPQIGQRLQVRHPEGQSFVVAVAEVTEDHVKLDANHPLAGQNLTFDIDLLEVE